MTEMVQTVVDILGTAALMETTANADVHDLLSAMQWSTSEARKADLSKKEGAVETATTEDCEVLD